MPYFIGGIPPKPAKVMSSKPPTTRPEIRPYFTMVRHMVCLLSNGWSRHSRRSGRARPSPERVILADSFRISASGHDSEFARAADRIGAALRIQFLEHACHVRLDRVRRHVQTRRDL